ncbi:MAG: bifunctional oligoribonuclease/PAP phosphatase NrnA [Bacteroidales bacterium]|nr:bifunctional oligoribonuclease/PAP phosphatase NrnA [Bacteroidales bacterium]
MNPLQKRDISTLARHIEQAHRIVIFSHVNPDGDSVGSCLGMYLHLWGKGKAAQVIIPNYVPDFLKWLPGADRIMIGKENPADTIRTITEADLIFYLDFNDIDRLEQLAEYPQKNRKAFHVVIDHHPGPNIKADLIFSDTTASSTAEIVLRVLQNLDPGKQADQPLATVLYAGIMTDTGCFRYNAAHPDTWEAVSYLMKSGIDNDDIYSRIYDNYSEHRMRLMGYALDKKMVILPEQHTGYIWLTKEELKAYRYVIGDTEGFVNLPLSVRGIRFSALFIELNNKIKISFRSKGSFAVNRFSSAYFNGGGHLNAAGGECYESMEDTLVRFKKLVRNFSDEI